MPTRVCALSNDDICASIDRLNGVGSALDLANQRDDSLADARPQPSGIAEGEHHRPWLSREQPIQRFREGFDRPCDEPASNRRVSSLAKLALDPGPIAVTTADQAETARVVTAAATRPPATKAIGADRIGWVRPNRRVSLVSTGTASVNSTLLSPVARITGLSRFTFWRYLPDSVRSGWAATSEG
jgi:hypothetical protein